MDFGCGGVWEWEENGEGGEEGEGGLGIGEGLS